MLRVESVFRSAAAVRQGGLQIPMEFQIGQELSVWVLSEEDNKRIELRGYMVAVHVDLDMLLPDIAFEVGSTGVYVVVSNVVAPVTPAGVSLEEHMANSLMENNPGCSREDALRTAYEHWAQVMPEREAPPRGKPRLAAVNTKPAVKEEQLQREEQEASAAERPYNGIATSKTYRVEKPTYLSQELEEKRQLYEESRAPTPVELRFAFRRDVWIAMSSTMPSTAYLHELRDPEGPHDEFAITYPGPVSARLAVREFASRGFVGHRVTHANGPSLTTGLSEEQAQEFLQEFREVLRAFEDPPR